MTEANDNPRTPSLAGEPSTQPHTSPSSSSPVNQQRNSSSSLSVDAVVVHAVEASNKYPVLVTFGSAIGFYLVLITFYLYFPSVFCLSNLFIAISLALTTLFVIQQWTFGLLTGLPKND